MVITAQQQDGSPEVRQEDLEALGPKAFGDPMGTPGAGEEVLWRGRPDVSILARTAFHTRSVGFYFLLLIGLSVAFGNTNAAIVCTVLGLIALGILHILAWISVRTTLYILTDARLIMRIGMAIETRINVPLKHVTSADLRMRGKNHGDIALQLGGERLLGYALMWPHVRPWRFNKPEPMLRAVPDAQAIAEKLADACAKIAPIDQNLSQIKDAAPQNPQQVNGPARAGAYQNSDLEGAHA